MTVKHSTLPMTSIQYEDETPDEIVELLEQHYVNAWHDGVTVWWLCEDVGREFDRGEFIAVPAVEGIEGVVYG